MSVTLVSALLSWQLSALPSLERLTVLNLEWRYSNAWAMPIFWRDGRLCLPGERSPELWCYETGLRPRQPPLASTEAEPSQVATSLSIAWAGSTLTADANGLFRLGKEQSEARLLACHRALRRPISKHLYVPDRDGRFALVVEEHVDERDRCAAVDAQCGLSTSRQWSVLVPTTTCPQELE